MDDEVRWCKTDSLRLTGPRLLVERSTQTRPEIKQKLSSPHNGATIQWILALDIHLFLRGTTRSFALSIFITVHSPPTQEAKSWIQQVYACFLSARHSGKGRRSLTEVEADERKKGSVHLKRKLEHQLWSAWMWGASEIQWGRVKYSMQTPCTARHFVAVVHFLPIGLLWWQLPWTWLQRSATDTTVLVGKQRLRSKCALLFNNGLVNTASKLGRRIYLFLNQVVEIDSKKSNVFRLR